MFFGGLLGDVRCFYSRVVMLIHPAIGPTIFGNDLNKAAKGYKRKQKPTYMVRHGAKPVVPRA